MTLFTDLCEFLERPSCTEREVHRLLKDQRDFITGVFADSWNYAETYPEVWLGADYRIDFLVLCANSGYWTAHTVELKSPTARLYLSNGDKAPDLRLVERQLAQRENWRRENEYAFRQVLAKLVPEGAAAYCSNAGVHQRARPELLDLQTVIHLQCHAVIGRSTGMSDVERNARRLDDQKRGEWCSPQVLTYDRLLSKARTLESRGAA
jgi:hypothetical protein